MGGSANPAVYYNTTSIAVFTCPNDANNFQKPSGLSYGVNAGYGTFPPQTSNPVTVTEADAARWWERRTCDPGHASSAPPLSTVAGGETGVAVGATRAFAVTGWRNARLELA